MRDDNRRVLVCQRGARHRYAVPRLLHEAGLLSALYTDSCSYSPLGKLASILARFGMKLDSLAALAGRKPTGIPFQMVNSCDTLLLSNLLGGRDSLAPTYRKWGLGGAVVVYSMYGEEPDFIAWAKAQGARIVLDVFVHPGTNRIVAAEESRFRGKTNLEKIPGEDEHTLRVFELADILLCPSEWVASGVRSFAEEHAQKIRIVPYGSSIIAAESISTPLPGRILFAGRDPLRKGLHYLAEAGYLLRQKGVKIDLRVAGIAQEDIGWMPHHEELNCLGTVPMEQMKQEYRSASLFVLPSLSEGQAGVLLEAMACGCAVVATKESGIDFEPGCGVTVPARDPEALAVVIERIINDDSYRNGLAEGALRQAKSFSMDLWKQRLADCINGCTGN